MGQLLSTARSPVTFRNADEAAKAGFDFEPAECPEPTDAQPGSAAKIEILAGRYEAGVSLAHPLDANCFPDSLAEIGDGCDSFRLFERHGSARGRKRKLEL
jgi:hypothetical protein